MKVIESLNIKEKAYTETKPNEIIDFSYAKFVNIK